MTKRRLAIFLLLMGVATCQSKQPRHAVSAKPETSHLSFAKEYVRELIEDEGLKTSAQKELNDAQSDNEKLTAGIYFSKSVQLELQSQIRVLKRMYLKPPFNDLIPSLTALYQQQINLHQQLIDMQSSLLAGPKPGVDYSAMPAKLPQIRAELENSQKGVFMAAKLVFMALVDLKPDSEGHASHLIITKAEKADLEQQLEIMLKDQPEHGDHDDYVGAAMILRGGFQKGHKCADEPWD